MLVIVLDDSPHPSVFLEESILEKKSSKKRNQNNRCVLVIKFVIMKRRLRLKQQGTETKQQVRDTHHKNDELWTGYELTLVSSTKAPRLEMTCESWSSMSCM